MIIAPREPLSQVVFIHDYFQLVFQGETLSVYNKASLQLGARVFVHGEPGFADALLDLFDQKAMSTVSKPGTMLALKFTSGAELCIHGGDASHVRTEAFSFTSQSGEFVVGQNE